MDSALVYRPWVAREGMAGWFQHLSRAYGNPNQGHNMDVWPKGVLERVCERGEAIPITFDRDCPNQAIYFTHQGIFVNGERVSLG